MSVGSRGGGVWFEVGPRRQLHVGVDEAFAPARKAHPALVVSARSLEALAERLVVAGAGVTWDASLSGVTRFYAEDPWGNRLELLAAPDPEAAT